MAWLQPFDSLLANLAPEAWAKLSARERRLVESPFVLVAAGIAAEVFGLPVYVMTSGNGGARTIILIGALLTIIGGILCPVAVLRILRSCSTINVRLK
jgi:hypothetical protein